MGLGQGLRRPGAADGLRVGAAQAAHLPPGLGGMAEILTLGPQETMGKSLETIRKP